LLIATSTVLGWVYGMQLDVSQFAFAQPLVSTPNRLLYASLGLVSGLIIAGATFGLAAAIFDMHRTLRVMARNQGVQFLEDDRQADESASQKTKRSEPHLAYR